MFPRTKLWMAIAIVAACNTQAPTASAPSAAAPAETVRAKPVASDDSAMLQAFIDTPALQQYYHVDVLPERKPLVLIEGPHTKGVTLEEFGVRVEVLPAERVGARPHLTIQKIERTGERAIVHFRYDVEALVGEVRLSRRDGAWRVDSHDIAER